LHLIFSGTIGLPSKTFFVVIMGRFLMQALELGWLSSLQPEENQARITAYASVSIWIHLLFAVTVSLLGGMEDSHYIALFLIPVLAAGFRATALGVGLIVIATAAANFLQLWVYFGDGHVPRPTEYFEAANVALIYPLVAVVVARVATQLRRDRNRLAASLDELARTRDRLLEEERLAAIGRLSAAIAHEVRNPVAMIASSFKQLRRRHPALEDDDLGQVVEEETARLERLVGDFLGYARRRELALRTTTTAELLGYVCEIARARAGESGVTVELADSPDLTLTVDPFQIHQALLNLVANGIDASAPRGRVTVAARSTEDLVELVVEDDGPAIPESVVETLFEPFVSTKATGSGLGLSVSRAIVRAHQGDLELERNRDGEVRFVLRLRREGPVGTEATWPAS
jgi:two-component system sensor histidine kinase HydH